MRFEKHYSVEEARAMLPQVRKWLQKLIKLRKEIHGQDSRIQALLEACGDVGGPEVNSWVRTMAQVKDVLQEFFVREIQIKDLDRGLIDFPALMNGAEVFLCWENGEKDILFWHDLEAGYAGRKRIIED